MELILGIGFVLLSCYLLLIKMEISRVADAIEDLNEICFDEILEQIGE